MSIYNDTQELKRIFEQEPVFKPATPAQVDLRKDLKLEAQSEAYGDILSDMRGWVDDLYHQHFELNYFNLDKIHFLKRACQSVLEDLQDAGL